MFQPLAAVVLGVAGLAAAGFTKTIGGSGAYIAILVVVLYGLTSLRERFNSGWKDRYEQELATSKQEREKTEEMVDRLEAERVIRHAIKDELAQARAQLEIEKSKPDLRVILDQQRELWASLTTLLTDMQQQQREILTLLEALAPLVQARA